MFHVLVQLEFITTVPTIFTVENTAFTQLWDLNNRPNLGSNLYINTK